MTDDEQQPDKPAILDMPPEAGVEPPSDQEEHEAGEVNLLSEEDAQEDETVDDGEERGPRADDLPDGATRDDYAETD